MLKTIWNWLCFNTEALEVRTEHLLSEWYDKAKELEDHAATQVKRSLHLDDVAARAEAASAELRADAAKAAQAANPPASH